VQTKSHAPGGSADLRRALAQFATGVTVVTTRAADGVPVGITANSFASVSLEPALVLWSLARSASSFEAFRAARGFRVHVLAGDQLEIAKRFATRGADKFAAGDWTHPVDAPPQLGGCVAWFECATRSQHDEGDHVIFVGRVESMGAPGGAPLIFHDSRYVTDLSEAPLPPSMLSTPWR
jgi:3-hydroxy-9,10-secoandrosta-1,3,5(10)-triene-9,17-dione monooxygenase reductase component